MGRERRAARIRRHGNAGMIYDVWCRTLKKTYTRACVYHVGLVPYLLYVSWPGCITCIEYHVFGNNYTMCSICTTCITGIRCSIRVIHHVHALRLSVASAA